MQQIINVLEMGPNEDLVERVRAGEQSDELYQEVSDALMLDDDLTDDECVELCLDAYYELQP